MSKRYEVLDTIRGIAVINMVLYHGCYDLVYLFDVPMAWFTSGPVQLWQQSICWTFIFLAGFCWSFHRKPLKAGVKVFFWGLVITGVTLLFMPEELIVFGILSFIGAAILLTIPVNKGVCRVKPMYGFVVAFFCFIGLLLAEPVMEDLGAGLPFNNEAIVIALAVLGFPNSDFVSSDYFPLLPWFFLYLGGYFFQKLVKEEGYTYVLSAYSCKPMAAVGRHALVVYLLHQPVIYLILYLALGL